MDQCLRSIYPRENRTEFRDGSLVPGSWAVTIFLWSQARVSEAWVSRCLSDSIGPHNKLSDKQKFLCWPPFMRCSSIFRYPRSEAETELLSGP